MSNEDVKPPLIWADFNNWRTTQLLALGVGSMRELADLVAEPREGMPLRDTSRTPMTTTWPTI